MLHLHNSIFTAAIVIVEKLSEVFLHVFKDLSSKPQRCFKVIDQRFDVFGMNSHNFIILVIFAEDWTSTDSFGYWHVKDEVVLVYVGLAVILGQFLCCRVAKYSDVFDGFLKLVFCL